MGHFKANIRRKIYIYIWAILIDEDDVDDVRCEAAPNSRAVFIGGPLAHISKYITCVRREQHVLNVVRGELHVRLQHAHLRQQAALLPLHPRLQGKAATM